jgi:hypothetical protein
VLVDAAPAAALNRSDIVGTWKVVSYLRQPAASRRTYPLGLNPSGYLIIDDSPRCTVLLVADGREPAHDDAGNAALATSMVAFSAPFDQTDDGDALKLTLHPDVALDPTMLGHFSVWLVSLVNDRLTVTVPNSAYTDTEVFERSR